MASRTRVICLHEGEKGRSIDPVFIRTLIKRLSPSWIRPWQGNNAIRTVPKGGRTQLIASLPDEIRIAQAVGSSTAILVWADLDHDTRTGDELKDKFWDVCKREGIPKDWFDEVVFVFAKDRLENWIEFLTTGKTDENVEGPRVKDIKQAATAAGELAQLCKGNETRVILPDSLRWSCENWKTFLKQVR